jgi:hypothetical protein
VPHDQILTTRVGLRFPERVEFETWARAGSHLARISDSSIWCLGDWLAYGQDRYSDGYQRTVEAVGLDYKTLRNYAWVTRRFDWSRRRAKLSFQHHAEVAAMGEAEQDRWLDRAEEAGWSRNKLRQHVRQSRDVSETGEQSVVLPRLAVPREQFGRWREAAEHSSSNFADWVVAVLDEAAARETGAA